MKSEDQTEIKIEESQSASQAVDKSRRSFSKKGLVAPVIMTLANRSAWGANVCLATGFQSFAVAGGVLNSIGTVNMSDAGTLQWLSPNMWYNNLGSWGQQTPNTFLPVKQVTPESGHSDQTYEIYSGGVWHKNNPSTSNKNYTKAEILALSPGIAFLYQLPGFGNDPGTIAPTIYDALDDVLSSAEPDLNVYQIVTAMNNLNHPLSSSPKGTGIGDAFQLSDYQLFYKTCVS